jgi:hypothetical protein
LLPLVLAAGCAKPVPLGGHEDMATSGNKGDLAGVDLKGADLAHTPANCDTGTHDCNGTCIPDLDCCTGADCPQYANSMAVCMGGTCMYMCNTGFAMCNGNCRSGNLCCADADCPAAPNTMGMHCSSTGMCSIAACATGYYDLDHMAANGCECQDAGKAQDCASATNLNTIAVGATQTVTGNLPDPMVSNWFTITFAANAANAHPHIVLSGNPGNQFFFDVVNDCTESTMMCGNEMGKTANTVTDWEVQQTGGGDPTGKGCGDTTRVCNSCNCRYPAYSVGTVGVNGNVRIHVYRAPSGNPSCDNYTLTITD